MNSFLNIEDQTKLEHYHDIVYSSNCPQSYCNYSYIGGSSWRFSE